MLDRTAIIDVFKILSDLTRLRMVRLLSTNQTQMCVCEFVDVLQERQYNVSKHLKAMERSGLIRGKKEGRWTYYGLVTNGDPVAETIFKLVAMVPDSEKQFTTDQKRYQKRIGLREKGRCRVGIQTPELAT